MPLRTSMVRCLILAGAGSGKTRVITHRIAHLVITTGFLRNRCSPSLSPTRPRRRCGTASSNLLAKGGRLGRRPDVSTFHSFCVRLLRRDGDRLAPHPPRLHPAVHDLRRRRSDLDHQVHLRASGSMRSSCSIARRFRASATRRIIKQTPQDFYKDTTDPKMARLAVIFERYEERLCAVNALDFDDLLLESVRLLQHDAEPARIYNRRMQLSDDRRVSGHQPHPVRTDAPACSEAHSNVCVVGDEDQSIYGWRGADIRNILDFEKDYPERQE